MNDQEFLANLAEKARWWQDCYSPFDEGDEARLLEIAKKLRALEPNNVEFPVEGNV